jgi:hypothetical protein
MLKNYDPGLKPPDKIKPGGLFRPILWYFHQFRCELKELEVANLGYFERKDA